MRSLHNPSVLFCFTFDLICIMKWWITYHFLFQSCPFIGNRRAFRSFSWRLWRRRTVMNWNDVIQFAWWRHSICLVKSFNLLGDVIQFAWWRHSICLVKSFNSKILSKLSFFRLWWQIIFLQRKKMKVSQIEIRLDLTRSFKIKKYSTWSEIIEKWKWRK